MPKILVMNAAAEQMSGRNLTRSQQLLAAKTAWRSSWFADAGDVIVTPVPIKDNFLAYIGRTLQFDPASVSIITLDQGSNGPPVLTDEHLLSPEIIGLLQMHTNGCDDWTIVPCYNTEGVAELASLLRFAEPAGRRFAAQRGCDILNRKSHFRQLATGVDLPLADGSIADTPATLARAIRKHLPRTGTVIIKADNGAGGMGNITLTTGPVKPLPGTRETRHISVNIDAMAAELWGEVTNLWCRTLVVESYHAASHMFYLEYFITDDGCITFLNSGTIRLRPDSDPHAKELVWIGLEIPADVPDSALSNSLCAVKRFVDLAAGIGYRGPLNIDAIVTEANELIFNEVNARWGGGSIMHALGERLFGNYCTKRHVLSSIRNVSSPPLEEVLHRLDDHNLVLDIEMGEGVLVLASDEHLNNSVECLLIAQSRARVRELEALLVRAVQP